jgi:hypothetical protein
VLRRIFGPKREEVTGGLRKLHNELYNLYSTSRRWTGHVAHLGKITNMLKILLRKPEEERPLQG